MNPRWSPDGSSIAFTADRYAGLYLLDVESGTVRELTDAPAAGFGFQWAPDGSSILTRVARFDGPRRLDAVALLDPISGTVNQLTEYRTRLPAIPRWDAAGANVVLFTNEGLEVFSVRPVEPGKRAPTAFVDAGSGLARVDVDAKRIERLSIPLDRQVLNATASPDGGMIAFEVLAGNLHVVNADGTGLLDLGPGNRPAWSPDGAWIVFMRTEDDGHTFTSSDLFAVRADGSNLVRLTNTPDRLEMNPDWSPEGGQIAYDDFTDGIIYRLPITY